MVAEVLSAYDEVRLDRFIFTETEDELTAVRMNGAAVGAGIRGLLYGVYARPSRDKRDLHHRFIRPTMNK